MNEKPDESLETGLIGGAERRAITIVDYDPRWPERFEAHAAAIAEALGDTALRIDHIGSTSVPGLAAKPIVDVLVVVPDSASESAYLRQLEAAGYELRVREPGWYQHRMFRTRAKDVHIHVYSEGCEEIERNLALRDRLRRNAEDRGRYERLKRSLAGRPWPDMNAYAAAKDPVIESILASARADGEPASCPLHSAAVLRPRGRGPGPMLSCAPMAQSLTEIKAMLAERGIRPKKALGQNFLHDHNQMRRILAAAELSPGDLVLEVGPGTGALSERLLEAGAELVAVELDDQLAELLRDRLSPWDERVRLIHGDALEGKHRLNPEADAALTGRPFKLVANLPYQVASPLLAQLATDRPEMGLAVVMVQKEVADRLAAGPGSKAYGPLGVMVQAMCRVERVGVLSPGCFWPPPGVDSAVVRLTRRDRPLTDDPAALRRTLQRVFGQRRKQIGSTLGRDATLPEGVRPTDRPERLTVEQLITISRAYS